MNLPGFLGYFMVRKVIAGEDLKRSAGTVTKRLVKRLAEKGLLPEASAKEGAAAAKRGARDLPRAERACRILSAAGRGLESAMADLEENDLFDFDHYPISKVEPGRIWLEVRDDRGRAKRLGPIAVAPAAAKLLRENWTIACATARVRGAWRLAEVANIYPD